MALKLVIPRLNEDIYTNTGRPLLTNSLVPELVEASSNTVSVRSNLQERELAMSIKVRAALLVVACVAAAAALAVFWTSRPDLTQVIADSTIFWNDVKNEKRMTESQWREETARLEQITKRIGASAEPRIEDADAFIHLATAYIVLAQGRQRSIPAAEALARAQSILTVLNGKIDFVKWIASQETLDSRRKVNEEAGKTNPLNKK